MKNIVIFNKKHPDLTRLIYPLLNKFPIPRMKIFLLRALIAVIFFSFFCLVSSCKTCKCPAYSSIQKQSTEVVNS